MHLSKLKRFGYALAILGLGLTLTACGKKNSENDKVTISILQSKVQLKPIKRNIRMLNLKFNQLEGEQIITQF